MAAALLVQVEQVGLSLFPRKSSCGRLFRVVRGGSPQDSPRSSPLGSPRSGSQWVVRGTGVSLFNSPVLSKAGLTSGTQD